LFINQIYHVCFHFGLVFLRKTNLFTLFFFLGEATLAQLNSNAALNKTSIVQAFNLIFSFFDKNTSINDDKTLTYAFTVIYNYFKSPKIVSITASVVLHMLSSCTMGSVR
jgi:hypothetical protein